MPIQVVCPGCKKRFNVSDKFAGKTGNCPKCKHEITVPEKGDEVVIHAPEDAGPKDSSGRSVSKPILREETRFSIPWAIGIGVAALAVLITAVVIRYNVTEVPPLLLVFGAVGLAPPLVLGGYSFLRDDELQAY